MDINVIRNDFPIFQDSKQSFVYLDNGATTQKPQVVIDRLSQYYSYENANIHRGSYPLSNRASQLYENARETLRDWIDAKDTSEIIFTKGSTESLNLVATSAFETWIRSGDNIIVTELEHSSNYFPWKHQCEKNEVEFREAYAESDGSLNREQLLKLMDRHTKLIAITAMSNVTGFRPELEKIIAEAHRNGTLVLVDASQEIVHRKISVQQMNCDFLCFSGHKLYGPMGTGVLYGKKVCLDQMAPYLYGGDMMEQGDGGIIHYRNTPGRYEAGTQNIGGILGLEAAIQYLNDRGFEKMLEEEFKLANYMKACMKRMKGVRILGPDILSSVISFEVGGFGTYDIGVLLANKGIAIRCGAHCAYPLLKRMGRESTCRISLAIYNTKADIERIAEQLEYICGSVS